MRKEIVETADAGDVSHSDSDSDGSDGSGRTGGRMAMLGLKKSPARAATVKNRQRVLILSSRGIIHRFRHLMSDLHVLMPHSRKENKLDTKQRLGVINELAELSNCNNALFFEVRKHKDLYMWLAKTPNGPSVKFHVQNIHTMDEMKMAGNCLKGSRPILSFDSSFEKALHGTDSSHLAHLPLIKELLTHAFATPKTSRKIKPFIDRVVCFSLCDGRIWFRNFQIVQENSTVAAGAASVPDLDSLDNLEDSGVKLVEIGPRFVLSIHRVFDGAFGGRTLYENPNYVSPNTMRRDHKLAKSQRYVNRTESAKMTALKRANASQLPTDEVDDVFQAEESS
ncbi:MAG: hypothetical protein SGCHY_000373 [Lobulomycetales sp.]